MGQRLIDYVLDTLLVVLLLCFLAVPIGMIWLIVHFIIKFW